MPFIRNARKIGNSIGLTIPYELAKKMKLYDGDELSIDLLNDKLIITNNKYKKEILNEKLKKLRDGDYE